MSDAVPYELNINEEVHEMSDLLDSPKIILTELETMNLETREKVSISRDNKFKSLQGRRFEVKK